MGHNSAVLGHPISTSFPYDSWSTDPQVLGCHGLVSELRYTNTYNLRGMGLGHDIYGASDTNVTAWYHSLGIHSPRA